MKTAITYFLTFFLGAFALVTLFLSSSIILDLFGVREGQGNYVLQVVWANFFCSILYLFAAYGFLKNKTYTLTLLLTSTIILLIAMIAFYFHIQAGGLYEQKTIGALIFRIGITLLFTIAAFYKIKRAFHAKES
jgi:lysylphosphatidylglycerol synthetase-like protein (DUF2156 family)